MDWMKAKNITLVALALTIVFLLFTYGLDRIKPEVDQEKVQNETLALLEEKGLVLEGELPLEHDRLPVLDVTFTVLDEDTLQDRLKSQSGIREKDPGEEDVKEYAYEFLKSCGIFTKHVKLRSYTEKEGTYRLEYENRVNGYTLEESNIVCTIKDGRVESLERFWLEPENFGETKRDTISASAALIQFRIAHSDIEKIYVSNIELIYWVDPSNFNEETRVSDTAFPTWRIRYNDGETAYINAYGDK